MKIDESQTIVVVNAFIEDYDVEAYVYMKSRIDIDSENINIELQKVSIFLDEVKKIAEDKTCTDMIKDIERLMSQTSQETLEAVQEAIRKILELRKKLDPILVKGNELLKYYSKKIF